MISLGARTIHENVDMGGTNEQTRVGDGDLQENNDIHHSQRSTCVSIVFPPFNEQISFYKARYRFLADYYLEKEVQN